jgi:L-rhamnose mutarotase
MQILIFATYASAEITNDCEQEYAGFAVTGNGEPINITIDNEKQILFACVPEFGHDGNLELAKDKLKEIWEGVGTGTDHEKRIFIHHRFSNDAVLNSIDDPTIKSSIAFYSHTDSPVWPILKDIKRICTGGTLEGGNEEEFKERFDKLWKLHLEKVDEERIRKLSIIKHRIMHWFLPMDIDFQGVAELLNQKQEDKAREYLTEILNEHKNNYYQEKLAALWYAFAKYQSDEGTKQKDQEEAQSEDQKKTHNIDVLLDKEEPIMELICGKTKEKVIKAWKSILNVSGLSYAEKNNAFSDIKHNSEAPICNFMRRLDSLKEKQASDNSVTLDLHRIIKINDASETLKDLMPNDTNLIKDISFHDWFRLLINCLTELEEALGDPS